MVVSVFVVSKILFRLLFESLLASERAKVIGLPVVFGLASGGGGINIHAAYGVMYGCYHGYLFSFDTIVTLIDLPTEGYITRNLTGIFAYLQAMENEDQLAQLPPWLGVCFNKPLD
jgi:hypothetical protein